METEIFGVLVNVPAQICGIIGLIIILIAYQLKKINYLWVASFSYLLFIAEALFLKGYANAITTGIYFIRNFFMIFFLKKKEKELPFLIAILFPIIDCLLLPIYYNGLLSLLPPAIFTINTITAENKNYYILKTGALVGEFSYIFYQFSIGAYIGVLRQIILCISIIISMIMLWIKQTPKKPHIHKKAISNFNK